MKASWTLESLVLVAAISCVYPPVACSEEGAVVVVRRHVGGKFVATRVIEPAACNGVLEWLKEAERGPIAPPHPGACKSDASIEIIAKEGDAKPNRTVELFSDCGHVSGRRVTAEQFERLWWTIERPWPSKKDEVILFDAFGMRKIALTDSEKAVLRKAFGGFVGTGASEDFRQRELILRLTIGEGGDTKAFDLYAGYPHLLAWKVGPPPVTDQMEPAGVLKDEGPRQADIVYAIYEKHVKYTDDQACSLWGRETSGLLLGIRTRPRGPASPVNIQITGLVVNKSEKTKEIDTFPLNSNVLSLNVYKAKDDQEPLSAIPPPLPPADRKSHIAELTPEGLLRFQYDLHMFSPELNPGTYWVEFRYDQAISPRVQIEITPLVGAPDEAAARKLALEWVKANGKEGWGDITHVYDRGDHWLVSFTLLLNPRTPVSHLAGVFIGKTIGKIQEVLGE